MNTIYFSCKNCVDKKLCIGLILFKAHLMWLSCKCVLKTAIDFMLQCVLNLLSYFTRRFAWRNTKITVFLSMNSPHEISYLPVLVIGKLTGKNPI